MLLLFNLLIVMNLPKVLDGIMKLYSLSLTSHTSDKTIYILEVVIYYDDFCHLWVSRNFHFKPHSIADLIFQSGFTIWLSHYWISNLNFQSGLINSKKNSKICKIGLEAYFNIKTTSNGLGRFFRLWKFKKKT